MITLSKPGGQIILPDRLIWADEHDWVPVAVESTYSTDGNLLVDVAKKKAGRSITLEGGDTEAWMTRAEVTTLRAWASIPGDIMTLTLRGAAYTVIFNDDPIKAELVLTLNDADITADSLYRVSLQFLEV